MMRDLPDAPASRERAAHRFADLADLSPAYLGWVWRPACLDAAHSSHAAMSNASSNSTSWSKPYCGSDGLRIVRYPRRFSQNDRPPARTWFQVVAARAPGSQFVMLGADDRAGDALWTLTW